MTLDEFLRELKKVKNAGFRVYPHRDILIMSSDGREHSPITAICYLKTGVWYLPIHDIDAAKKLGISRKDRRDLIEAIYSEGCLPELYKRILEALDCQ
jgi:hypothetical protein